MNRHWLIEKIAGFGPTPAIVDGGITFSYSELIAEVDSIKAFLDDHDIRQSEVAAVMGDYAFKTIAAFLALMENKNIQVPSVAKKLQEVLSKYSSQAAQ